MNTLNLYEHPAAKQHTINLSRYARTRMALTFAWMSLGFGLVWWVRMPATGKGANKLVTPASVAAYVRPARPGAWSKRLGIWPTTSSRIFRYASGCFRCPYACAIT